VPPAARDGISGPPGRSAPFDGGLSFLKLQPGAFLQAHLAGRGAAQRAERKRPSTPSLGAEPPPSLPPAERLKLLRRDVASLGRDEALYFLEHDVFDACVSSIGRSGASYASQIKVFFSFCEAVAVEPLAITEPLMCAYAQFFRNGRSLKGYLSAVKWLFDACFAPIGTWAGRSLALVVRGVLAGTPPLKKAPAISWEDAERLYVHARKQRDFLQAYAYALASAFSLRVPDECLPLCFSDLAAHSSLSLELLDDGRRCVTMHLRRRKNARCGARLRRFCACAAAPGAECCRMCPVLCLRTFLADTGKDGLSGRVFARPGGAFLSESSFARVLRAHCAALKLSYFAEASSHGFRRGTAMAVMKRGGGLSAILESGGWTSSAFLQYLDREALDSMAVYELFESSMSSSPADAAAPVVPANRRAAAAAASKCLSIKEHFARAVAAEARPEAGPLALGDLIEDGDPLA